MAEKPGSDALAVDRLVCRTFFFERVNFPFKAGKFQDHSSQKFRTCDLINSRPQLLFSDKLEIVYYRRMPYVRNASHIPCDGLRKIRKAGSWVSCNVTMVPVSSWKWRQQPCYRRTKAHIVGCEDSGSYGDVFDAFAIDKESEVAIVVLIHACLEKL